MLLRLNGQISTATLRTLVESLPRRLKVMLWQQSGTHSSLNAHGLGPGTYRSDDQASTYFWPCIINNITTIPTDVVTNDERKKKWIEILYVFHLLVVLLNSISRFLIRLITRIRCLRECLWIAQACGLPWGSWISMQSLMVSFAHKRDYDSTEGQYIVYMLYTYIYIYTPILLTENHAALQYYHNTHHHHTALEYEPTPAALYAFTQNRYVVPGRSWPTVQ